MKRQAWLPGYTRTITRRRFLAGAAAGAGAAALIACGGSGEKLALEKSIERTPGSVLYSRESYLWPDETNQAASGGTYLGVSTAANLRSYDVYIDGSQAVAGQEVYEYPMRANRGPGIAPGSAEALSPRPGLAESLEASSDGLTYTFTIRRGVKFHPVAPVNGREMDIEDWRSSFERYEAMDTHRADWLSVRDKVEYPDSRHVVVKLKAPYGPFIARSVYSNVDLVPAIMPKELNASPDLAATKSIGTAYRMLSSYQPSQNITYTRFDGYWDGKAYIDAWNEPIIPEYANRMAQFIAKHTTTFGPNLQDALDIKRQVPEALMVAAEIDYFQINRFTWGRQEKDTAPWGDPRVRIAMHRAVNWDAILEFLSAKSKFEAQGIQIETAFTTHVPNDPQYWLDPRKDGLGSLSQNYLYSVDEAKKLMTAAGYPDGVDMPLLAESTASGAGSDLWPIYHDEIKKSGIIRYQIELFADSRSYRDRVFQSNNNFKGRSWQSSGGDIADVDYHLSRSFRSSGVTAAYVSPKMDELYDLQIRESDPVKRGAHLKEMQKEAAMLWPVGLGNHRAAGWTLEWPWLHNAGYPTLTQGHKQWLDKDMPGRNG
jgi:ABC-type transport system substrate-binding protein